MEIKMGGDARKYYQESFSYKIINMQDKHGNQTKENEHYRFPLHDDSLFAKPILIRDVYSTGDKWFNSSRSFWWSIEINISSEGTRIK
jgi:hypothetical protein